MYCNNCGKKIENGSEYCRFCGAEQYTGRQAEDLQSAEDLYERESYEDYDREEHHSPTGIILVTLLTVGLFLLLVVATKTDLLKKIDLKKFQFKHVTEMFQKDDAGEDGAADAGADDAVPEEQNPIVGSYHATSAVYNGMKMNSMALKIAGYQILFDVYADGTFSAALNEELYDGTWYRDGSYVEFYSGEMTMTGEFADGVLSLSDSSQGISVVLER